MPKLRMPIGQQAIYDDLSDYAKGARMMNAVDLARYWGRDVRCVRDWLQANGLPRYRMGNGYSYSLRDISRAIYQAQAG